MALLTILCSGFLDNFVNNFLKLYLFCFICSTKFVHAVQKSVVFLGGGWGGGGCRSLSMDSLLLSKTFVIVSVMKMGIFKSYVTLFWMIF
jgi:hypothetical protein